MPEDLTTARREFDDTPDLMGVLRSEQQTIEAATRAFKQAVARAMGESADDA